MLRVGAGAGGSIPYIPSPTPVEGIVVAFDGLGGLKAASTEFKIVDGWLGNYDGHVLTLVNDGLTIPINLHLPHWVKITNNEGPTKQQQVIAG